MMTLVDCTSFEKLQIKYPTLRHATLGDIMPQVVGMKVIVLLNDAYLEDERICSIQELKCQTGFNDLAKLKIDITLTEGKKFLPNFLIEELGERSKTFNVERNDCGNKECWKIGSSYLTRDLLEPFEDPVGVFTIVAENESWLIHTRDDEPWIYCLLPDFLAKSLLDAEPSIVEEVGSDFPYS